MNAPDRYVLLFFTLGSSQNGYSRYAQSTVSGTTSMTHLRGRLRALKTGRMKAMTAQTFTSARRWCLTTTSARASTKCAPASIYATTQPLDRIPHTETNTTYTTEIKMSNNPRLSFSPKIGQPVEFNANCGLRDNN
jgi:hypothetical protein